ncbi:arf-GAP with dual PH domain-containing protein 1-like isoform X1 [Paramormyrops kingsleyae]|uniref:ArfGAP with dual PH domains 1 n=3 Tax=Paramormyrops kingsleyae TaxID=1676925 RepID=A0A3B3RHL7_9TELE|nr:arf-GAP with dual PH domain-containing protein 1-like isoform X1 [Paramormyrops kingsleyae]
MIFTECTEILLLFYFKTSIKISRVQLTFRALRVKCTGKKICFPEAYCPGGDKMTTENDTERPSLKSILKQPGNDICADCGAPDPQWGSCTLGVLLCHGCSGIHMTIMEISKIKPLVDSKWADSEVQFLAAHGNKVAKLKYETAVPIYYHRPKYLDAQILKEQWIKAKYERQEFMDPMKRQTYQEELREGYLMKRGRDNGQYLSRRFVLTEKEGTLKYYTKEDNKVPKVAIKVDVINATFQPEKIGHSNGLQISFLKDNRTRNLFLFHEDGRVMVDWFNAIRAVQFRWLKLAFPAAPDQELTTRMMRMYVKEGFMEKTGPRQTEVFKKRWFTLDNRRLMYFKDPLDAFAKGELFLGQKDLGYSASPGLPEGRECGEWSHGITVTTPERSYVFTCESEGDQQDWLRHFNKVINSVMSPQDFAMESLLKHR